VVAFLLPLFSVVDWTAPVIELRAGLPFGVVRDELVEPVEPKPLPLEGDDSTAPLEDSTALGAD
jgi:hypothetical protein